MMNYAPKSIFARCRTQVRSLTSVSSLTRTFTCSDSNYYLNIHALRSNVINPTKDPLPVTSSFYDNFLLDVSSANIELPKAHFQHDEIDLEETIQAMNRNARKPKKANKGSRPYSRASRRRKKEKIGKRSH